MKRLFLLLLLLLGLDAAWARPRLVHNAQGLGRDTPIITGLFGSPSTNAQIVIHDAAAQPSWTWSIDEAKNVSDALRQCLHEACKADGCVVPEVKWAEGGNSIVSIFGFAAVVINHHPGRASDKHVSFGVCTNRDDMANAHSAELLPDGNLAVATTSAAGAGNIAVFARSRGHDALAAPVQQLGGIPAVHAVLWDPRRRLLWAAGNDLSPLVAGSRSILNAYAYADAAVDPAPRAAVVVAAATRLTAEWGPDTPWWDGSHAMVPVPGRNKLLITTDLDVHLYDIDTHALEHGQSVAESCLPGFQPAGPRVGQDGVSLPRSDIKSLSMLPNGDTLYVQALWNQTYGETVQFLANGALRPTMWKQMLYRSRWFADTAW